MRFLNNRRFLLMIALLAVYVIYNLSFASPTAETPSDTTHIMAENGEVAAAEHEAGGDSHGGPVLPVLLELIVILLAAKLGGDVFERIKAPAVLGELVVGMLIGNMHLLGIDVFQSFMHNETLYLIFEVLAELGVIILLFEVGLESTVKEMMSVGVTSFMVATFGVVAPFFLGWGVGAWFLPDEPIYIHLFLGATLTATSVGITARVLKDVGKIDTREAKIILGAAVIDDILGLVILAVVTGVIAAVNHGGGEGISSLSILIIIAKAVAFIVGAIALGNYVLPSFFKFGLRLKGKGIFLSFSLLVCFLLSYLAGKVGLAPIVGAFAAGLILEEVHFRDWHDRGEHSIHELIEPIAIFLVPIFFVRMGMMVDLTAFGRVEILGFAAVLTLAAIIGKQACAFAIFDKRTNRMAIGLGMIPRGEVGLIFAGIGLTLYVGGHEVVTPDTYAAVIIMVIVTTLVTPPLLIFSMTRGDKKPHRAIEDDKSADKH